MKRLSDKVAIKQKPKGAEGGREPCNIWVKNISGIKNRYKGFQLGVTQRGQHVGRVSQVVGRSGSYWKVFGIFSEWARCGGTHL
jgi:hypothetical protein